MQLGKKAFPHWNPSLQTTRLPPSMPFFQGIISLEHCLAERELKAATQKGSTGYHFTTPSLCMLGSEQLTHSTLTLSDSYWDLVNPHTTQK